MSIYIDADVLKAYWSGVDGRDEEYIDTIRTVIDVAPTADVAPVVHGAWIVNNPKITPICSNCGDANGIQRIRALPRNQFPAFCPSCGAKMDIES